MKKITIQLLTFIFFTVSACSNPVTQSTLVDDVVPTDTSVTPDSATEDTQTTSVSVTPPVEENTTDPENAKSDDVVAMQEDKDRRHPEPCPHQDKNGFCSDVEDGDVDDHKKNPDGKIDADTDVDVSTDDDEEKEDTEDDGRLSDEEAEKNDEEIRKHPYIAVFDFAFDLIDKKNSDIKPENFADLNLKIEFGKKFLSCSAKDMSVLNYEENESYWTGIGSGKNKRGDLAKDAGKGGLIGGGVAAGLGTGAAITSGVAMGLPTAGGALVAANTIFWYSGVAATAIIGPTASTAITTGTATAVGSATGSTIIAGGAAGSAAGPVGIVIGVAVGIGIGVGTYIAKHIETDGGAFNILFNPSNPRVFEKCRGNFKNFKEYVQHAQIKNISQMSVDVKDDPKISLGIKKLQVRAALAHRLAHPVKVYDNPAVMTYLNSNMGRDKDGERVRTYPNQGEKCMADNIHQGFLYDTEKFIGIRNRGGEDGTQQGIKFYPVAPTLILSSKDMAVMVQVQTDDNRFSGTERDVFFSFQEKSECRSDEGWAGIFEKMDKNQMKTAYFFTSAVKPEDILNGGRIFLEMGAVENKLVIDKVLVNVIEVFNNDGKFRHHKLEKKINFELSKDEESANKKFDYEDIPYEGKKDLDDARFNFEL